MASTELEARYAELEAAAEHRRRARMRRQPLVLLALLQALTIAIGVVGSVDLRRLRTPQGVALRWTQAATFGECDDYLHYSVGPAEDRPRAEVCRALRAATAAARSTNSSIRLAVTSVRTSGSSAVVDLDVGPSDRLQHAVLHLRRDGGRWVVVRDGTSCAVVLCA